MDARRTRLAATRPAVEDAAEGGGLVALGRELAYGPESAASPLCWRAMALARGGGPETLPPSPSGSGGEDMAQINVGRVIGAGLLAGLIMNVSQFVLHAVVLARDGAALMEDWKKLGLNIEPDPMLLLWLVVLTFGLGVMALWTYAAIRPRFGPGPQTAVVAGLAVWALSYFYAGVYVYAGVVIMPMKLTWLPVAWSLVEVPVATLAGAWLYKE